MLELLQKKTLLLWVFILLGPTLFLLLTDFSSGVNKKILRAQEHIHLHDYQKAAELYEEILLNPLSLEKMSMVVFQLSDLYLLYLNKPFKATQAFTRFNKIKKLPLSWKVKSLEKMADIYFSFIKNFSMAAEYYSRLISIHPGIENRALYEYRLSLSYLHLKDYQKAREAFLKVMEGLEKNYRSLALFYTGISYFEEQNWPMAIKWFSQCQRDEFYSTLPSDKAMMSSFLLANSYEMNGDLKGAYASYWPLLNSYPNSDVIKKRLQNVYQRRVARKR